MKKLILICSLSLLMLGTNVQAVGVPGIPDFSGKASFRVFFENMFGGSIPQNAVRVPLIVFELEALERDSEIRSVTLQHSGLSDPQDIDDVWVETANFRRSSKGRFIQDSQAIVTFRTPVVIPAGQKEKFYVMANFDFGEKFGNTVKISVVDINAALTETAETKTKNPLPPVSATERVKSVPAQDKAKKRIRCKNRKCWWQKIEDIF